MAKIQSVLFLIIAAAVSEIFADEESLLALPIELISDPADEDNALSSTELVRGPPQVLPCNNFWGVRCASCTHLQVCLGNEQVDVKRCGDINQNTPFCNDRSCTATVPEGCKNQVPSTSFTCTDIGLFPNTNNCSRFFLCSQIGDGPREFECPSPFIYNSKNAACQRRITNNDCQIIDCSRQSGQFVIYNPDKSVLAYCAGQSSFPVLTRCPDYENQEYDPNTLKCEFVCRSEGRFADKLDCKKYYECLRNGASFIKIHRDCDPLVYDPSSRQCKLSTGGCQNQITTTTARPSTPNPSNPSNPSTAPSNPSSSPNPPSSSDPSISSTPSTSTTQS